MPKINPAIHIPAWLVNLLERNQVEMQDLPFSQNKCSLMTLETEKRTGKEITFQ